MGRSMQDIAEHSAYPRNFDSQLQARTLESKHYHTLRSNVDVCLGRALLSCRCVVKSAEPFLLSCRGVVKSVVLPFLLHVALVLLLGFLLKLLASPPLLFLLHPIRAFLLCKLCDAITFVLSTFTIGLLCFLFSNISMNNTSAAPINRSIKIRKGKRKKAEHISDPFCCCNDDISGMITPNVTGRLSRWLFESSDECSCTSHVGDQSSSSCELEAEHDRFFEEDKALSKAPQPQAAIALGQQEDALSTACANDAECKSEVHLLQVKANSNHKHSRSRSYSSGLNLPNTVTASAAQASMGHRRASLSCDWGSGTEFTAPWLENTHVDLHSPPLPPFAVYMLEEGSNPSSEMSATALQSKLVPWRASHKSNNEKTAETESKLPDIIDDGEGSNHGRRARDELQERSEAFIIQQQQQWQLQRLASLQRLRGTS